MSVPSLENPQHEPADHAYVILQNHGPEDGGWGPSAIYFPPLPPTPFVYTGDSPAVLKVAKDACQALADMTGKETRLARYSHREDICAYAPRYK